MTRSRRSRGGGRKIAKEQNLREQAKRFISARSNRGQAKISGKNLRSDRTVQRYQGDLGRAAESIQQEYNITQLKQITQEQAQAFIDKLEASGMRARTVQGYAKALETLPNVAKLEAPARQDDPKDRPINSRAYTSEQVKEVQQFMSERGRLASQICYEAGCRVQDLASMRLTSEVPVTNARLDQLQADRFIGREEWVHVTFTGKGGHHYESTIHPETARDLEQYRLAIPKAFNDRGLDHAIQQYYNLPAGKALSNQWSEASNQALGYSHGAHGLRHAFAQERVANLQERGMTWDQALERTSQQLGHYRPEEINTYLR